MTKSIFHLDSDGGFTVTPEIKKSYQDNGFVIIRQILNKQEVKLIGKGWSADPYLRVYDQRDGRFFVG